MKKQQGFTLIELVIVIIILGILAAFAIPKYMELDKKARKATVLGLVGSLRSAKTLVHTIGKTAKSTGETMDAGWVNIGTENIAVTSALYPSANAEGIGSSLEDASGFTLTNSGTVATYAADGATTAAACQATYTEGNPPTIAYNIDDCS
jgi:MSHA pilin protein MshA